MAIESLEYLKLAAKLFERKPEEFEAKIKINLVTNFTDDILKNVLTGASLHDRIYPDIFSVPYKQYATELKNEKSGLFSHPADITFVFFDMNPYKRTEFLQSREHFLETLEDIRRYAASASGIVILNTFILSYEGGYGNHFERNPFYQLVREYNEALKKLADEIPSVYLSDTNRLVHRLGETNVRDMRWLHTSDIPFTQRFTSALAEEWMAYVRTLLGKSKKCIVLDLDNTLWGGVIGESDPLSIGVGPDYPGSAFVNFQHALLDFYNRGIILAVASKNNMGDVVEVFEKNPHMVLREKHFSAIRADWKTKPQMIREIAEELNIGTESMVFLDDDPLNREMVREELPEVAVPDFSIPPEEYTPLLYSLDLFHQFSLTEEDLVKGRMYAQERERRQVEHAAKDPAEYIAQLGLKIVISVNDAKLVPRISQLTQKTNQFNLTTRRYAEADIERFMKEGLVVSANVTDKFGDYGTVIAAIVSFDKKDPSQASLDTLLMSCRVMGRGVECAFMDHLVRLLHGRKVASLGAEFISTKKNVPAKGFLPEHGFTLSGEEGGVLRYALPVVSYIHAGCPLRNPAIEIT